MDDEISDWDIEDGDDEGDTSHLIEGHDMETCGCEQCVATREAMAEGEEDLRSSSASEDNPDGDFSGFSINFDGLAALQDAQLLEESADASDEEIDAIDSEYSDPDFWRDQDESPFRVPDDFDGEDDDD